MSTPHPPLWLVIAYPACLVPVALVLAVLFWQDHRAKVRQKSGSGRP